MQHLYWLPGGSIPFRFSTTSMSSPGKVLRVVELNHTLRCLCGNPSIPLSFNLAAVIPRRRTYRVSFGTDSFYTTNTKFASFTAWTTGVSNPVCYPCFRVLASGPAQETAFASGVPPDIYAFHYYTGNSISLYRPRVWQYRTASPS